MGDEALFRKLESLFDSKFAALSATLATKEEMKNLATKDDIVNMRDQINGDLGVATAGLQRQIDELKIMASKKDRRIELLEMEACKNNVIIRGLTFEKDENLIQKADKFFREILKVEEPIQVEFARKIGREGGEQLLAALSSSHEEWIIIKRSPTLRGTGYGISQDFPYAIRRRRSKLFRIRAELRKHKPNQPSKILTEGLLVNGKVYNWDGEVGLRSRDGGQVVYQLAGVDLKVIIAALLAEDQEETAASPRL